MTLTREQRHVFVGGLVMALLWTLLWATACVRITDPPEPEPPAPCLQRYWPPIQTSPSSWISYPMEPICPK